jgi:hypothetical protein
VWSISPLRIWDAQMCGPRNGVEGIDVEHVAAHERAYRHSLLVEVVARRNGIGRRYLDDDATCESSSLWQPENPHGFEDD